MINVVFKDNTASLSTQGKWIDEIMSSVKSKYNTNQVNIVAHRMGGLDAIQYIEEQHSKKSFPKFDK